MGRNVFANADRGKRVRSKSGAHQDAMMAAVDTANVLLSTSRAEKSGDQSLRRQRSVKTGAVSVVAAALDPSRPNVWLKTMTRDSRIFCAGMQPLRRGRWTAPRQRAKRAAKQARFVVHDRDSTTAATSRRGILGLFGNKSKSG